MLKIEHGVTVGRAVVARRSVDEHALVGIVDRRVIATLHHFAVRHIGQLKSLVTLGVGHFKTRSHDSAAEERLACRVGNPCAVNNEEIVVETGHKRIGDATPHTVVVACHVIKTAKVELNLLGFGSLNLKCRTIAWQDAGHLRTTHGIYRNLPFGLAGIPGNDGVAECQRQKHYEYQCLFHFLSDLNINGKNSLRQRRHVSHS